MPTLGSYIPLYRSLLTHPKLEAAMVLLKCSRPLLVGSLVELWSWASEYAPTGDLSRLSDRQIATAALWKGDPTRFVTALATCYGPSGHAFIDLADGQKLLHDWDDYAGLLNDLKARNRNYQAQHREKLRAELQGKTDRKMTSHDTNLTSDDRQLTSDDANLTNLTPAISANSKHDSHALSLMSLGNLSHHDGNLSSTEPEGRDSTSMVITGPRPPWMPIGEYLRRHKNEPMETNETPPVSAPPPETEQSVDPEHDSVESAPPDEGAPPLSEEEQRAMERLQQAIARRDAEFTNRQIRWPQPPSEAAPERIGAAIEEIRAKLKPGFGPGSHHKPKDVKE